MLLSRWHPYPAAIRSAAVIPELRDTGGLRSGLTGYRAGNAGKHRPGSMAFNVRMLKRDDIGASLIAAWDALEARACQPNAYLSSSFVLPALEHLTASADVRIVVVEEPADAAKPAALLGLGIFKLQAPTRTLPVRHLASYECIHSYLGGLLIDREYSVATLNALFRFLAQPGGEWHAVLFSKFPSDGFWAESCLRQAEACGLAWHETCLLYTSPSPRDS